MVQHKGQKYMWPDNEVDLLLNIILKYKVNKPQESTF